ncbi:HAAS signaling domain-containing protein [Blastococcus mobilis]|uniref:Uncharacterized protein n=1 Tax=Blastococcus mobilis TaxID=1938746 RepID=A0A238VRM0_9ACTN|nr:hypothetical protein [Blastococcus mobilis]SNR36443.1 hypothetical protein SAMN06272737_104117 [Blastococcus mobilis]
MTAATDSTTRQAQDYLAAVEHELADLPTEDRSALLEDLAQHLDALAAEDDDRPVAVRLGPPAAYAADLRSAAGLPARGGVARAASLGMRERLDAVLATPAGRRIVPAAREVGRLLGELRPAWWVLRGYLVVLLPCLHELDGVSDFPVPAPLDNHLLGAVLVVAAVAGSVALGRRRMPRPLGLLVAASGVVVLLFTFVAWDRSEVSRGTYLGAAGTSPPEHAIGEYPLLSRYGPVTDVLPYAADGTPLEGALLYDQDGRPLQVGFQEWWADRCVRVLEQPLAADGVPVPHSFPQSYELLGLDVDIHSVPVSPGQCATDLPRPHVPLPVFPAESATD